MTTFTVTITDAAKLAGITAARSAYNNTLQPVQATNPDGTPKVDDEQKPVMLSGATHPDYKADDNSYVQFVMDGASESYSKQYA